MDYLPFIPSDNNYTLRTSLGDEAFELDVHWNSRDEAWYFDLYDSQRTPILMGIKVVLGSLGASRQFISFFQTHILRVIDTTGKGKEAGYDDLGDRVQVLHTTIDEFKALGS